MFHLEVLLTDQQSTAHFMNNHEVSVFDMVPWSRNDFEFDLCVSCVTKNIDESLEPIQ